jgi:N-acetylneuraminate lyase
MESNDVETARAFQMQSVEMVKIIIKYGGGVRGGKAIMNLIGVECGTCRPPLAPFEMEEYDSLKEDLRRFGLFIN